MGTQRISMRKLKKIRSTVEELEGNDINTENTRYCYGQTYGCFTTKDNIERGRVVTDVKQNNRNRRKIEGLIQHEMTEMRKRGDVIDHFKLRERVTKEVEGKAKAKQRMQTVN